MKDAFPANPATFGGIVARMADDGRSVHAVATLVDAGTLALVATHEARVQVDVDGDALPALLEALAGLPGAPAVVLAEGLETAVRFGAATDLPCIGIGIAIPALIFYRHFKNKVDTFVVEMEQRAGKLVDIVHGERAA